MCRPFSAQLPLGSTMIGTQVARCVSIKCIHQNIVCCTDRVKESKNKDFAVGDYVVSKAGWIDRSVGTAETCTKLDVSVPDDKHSTALGVLGMPGY